MFPTDVEYDNPAYSDDDNDSIADDGQLETGTNALALYIDDLQAAGTLCITHVEQYCDWGNVHLSEGGRQILRFLSAAFCGSGASTRTAQAMLNFTHSINGSCYALPATIKQCWKYVARQHAAMTRPRKVVKCTYPVPPSIQLLMTEPMATITMEFVDPTEALVRLLVCSPLAKHRANMAFFPEPSAYYDEFCTGERMKRIHNCLPPGSAALTGVIFFDEINQDKKGFATGEGAIIVGFFFRKDARESTYAKASIGTFPGVRFPKVWGLLTHLAYYILMRASTNITHRHVVHAVQCHRL
jgi:hypothetical protein